MMVASRRDANDYRHERERRFAHRRLQQRLAQEEQEANEEHIRPFNEKPQHGGKVSTAAQMLDSRDSDDARSLDEKQQRDEEAPTSAQTPDSCDKDTANLESDSNLSNVDDSPKSYDSRIHFFDLPQEVRDMIYARFPGLASIHINQDPSRGALQPSLSKVSRRMRQESLDVFYGKNNFFLDLRGWKNGVFPKKWTPGMIFEHWISAIGNENAARLRSLKFYSHNFSVNVRLSNESPPTLTMKFRTFISKAEVGEGVSASYDFATAARRAEYGLRRLLDWMQRKTKQRGLDVHDFKTTFWAVNMVQPFLCRRISLGYQGAVLREDDVPISQWPSVAAHLDKCDDCGYHRYTRASERNQEPSDRP